MRVVLGIDASWTPHNPSGVALAISKGSNWLLAGAFPSYQQFLDKAGISISSSDNRSLHVSAAALVDATRVLTGKAPDLVAVDMPMSLKKIEGRRSADQAISKAYGAKWCAAHSPNAVRPGHISDNFRQEFSDLGYPLCIQCIETPGLIEVYPHPALVELCGEKTRLPYKVSKVRGYWPSLTPKQRRCALVAEWGGILTVLEPYLNGAETAIHIPVDGQVRELKAVEDMLDAVVCCVVGIRAMEGAARPFSSDDQAAIWVPQVNPKIQERTLLPGSPYSARAEMRLEFFADSLQNGMASNK